MSAKRNQKNSYNGKKGSNPRSGKDRRKSGKDDAALERAPRGASSMSVDSARTHCGNDPAWYAANAQLMADSASLAYSNNLGSPLGVISEFHYTTTEDPQFAIPGIMVLRTAGTPGYTKDNSSPINVAARNLYSYVRHANSGHSNYDSPDLMLYILGMCEAYSMWGFMTRAYGVINTYSTFNRYYPRAVFEAMGLDFTDFQRNIADFRAFINEFAFKLGSICVPSSMSLYARRVWMYSKLWVDDECKKPQTYMYTPDGFYVYSETSSQTGGQLKYTKMGEAMTFAQLRDMANSLVSAILESEDMMIMSGDILKAFGEGGIMKVSTIDENFMVVPEYSPEVCSQIQNACVLPTIVGKSIFTNSLTISQNPDTGAIIFTPKLAIQGTLIDKARMEAFCSFQYRLFNMRSDTVKPEDNMVASRLMVWARNEGGYFTLTEFGTEVVVSASIGRYVRDHEYMESEIEPIVCLNWTETSDSQKVMGYMHDMCMMEKFDYHPYQYLFMYGDDNGTLQEDIRFAGFTGDVMNYTKLTEYECHKMNNVALLSEFGAPTMGAFA